MPQCSHRVVINVLKLGKRQAYAAKLRKQNFIKHIQNFVHPPLHMQQTTTIQKKCTQIKQTKTLRRRDDSRLCAAVASSRARPFCKRIKRPFDSALAFGIVQPNSHYRCNWVLCGVCAKRKTEMVGSNNGRFRFRHCVCLRQARRPRPTSSNARSGPIVVGCCLARSRCPKGDLCWRWRPNRRARERLCVEKRVLCRPADGHTNTNSHSNTNVYTRTVSN